MGPKTLVSEAFCIGSADAQFHADTPINGIPLPYSGGAGPEMRGASTGGKDAVHTGSDTETIEL